MLRIMTLLIGIGLTLIGCITVFLPIPGGVLPLIVGVLLLVTVSSAMQQLLRQARQRYAWLDKQCDYAEEKMQRRLPKLANALARTRP